MLAPSSHEADHSLYTAPPAGTVHFTRCFQSWYKFRGTVHFQTVFPFLEAIANAHVVTQNHLDIVFAQRWMEIPEPAFLKAHLHLPRDIISH